MSGIGRDVEYPAGTISDPSFGFDAVAAIGNLRKICEEHLAGRYKIEVVDLLENPALARGDQILAIPTLVRKLPVPMRKIIGDLSDRERVLVGLDLRPES